MKLKFIFIFVFIIGLASFEGCTKSTERDAEKIAKKFVTQFYGVNYEKSEKALVSIDNLLAAHDDFKDMMTSEAVKGLIADRMYVRNLQFSDNNRCSMKIQAINLSKRFYDNKENKIGFDYDAKIEVTYDKDNRKEIEEEKGYVGLEEENNQWEIYAVNYTQLSQVFMKK